MCTRRTRALTVGRDGCHGQRDSGGDEWTRTGLGFGLAPRNGPDSPWGHRGPGLLMLRRIDVVVVVVVAAVVVVMVVVVVVVVVVTMSTATATVKRRRG